MKSLQVEAKRKGSSVVHSDNADASEFIHVLEAAFVLGLKVHKLLWFISENHLINYRDRFLEQCLEVFQKLCN